MSRTFQVSVNGCTSARMNVPNGVPQDSILSPTLYNIFPADLIRVDGIHYNCFADDTGFLTSHRVAKVIVEKLQLTQESIQKHEEKWKVIVNSIFFTRRRSPKNLAQNQVTGCRQDIPWLQNVTNLGVVLYSKLNFGKHNRSYLQTCEKLIRTLYLLVNRRSRKDLRTKIYYYTFPA